MCSAKTIMSAADITGLLRLYNLDAFHIFLRVSKFTAQHYNSERSRGNSAQVVFIFTLIWRILPSLSSSFFPSLLPAVAWWCRTPTYWFISYPHLCCQVVKGHWAADNLGWMRMRSLSKLFDLPGKEPGRTLCALLAFTSKPIKVWFLFETQMI